MRSLPIPKRWLIAGGIVIGLFALVMLTLGVIYPRVGAYMVREKVGGRLAGKLGRKVTFGDIDVSLGHAVLRNVEIRGPLDGDMPLVHIDRVDVDFDTMPRSSARSSRALPSSRAFTSPCDATSSGATTCATCSSA